MKYLKYIFLLFISLLTVTSCETYGDYDVEYTPIHPLGGQYRIHVYNAAGEEVYTNYCYIGNTSDYATDKCWIRIGAYNLASSNAWAINGKISCNVDALTFSGADIMNLAGNVASSTETFTVTDGKVVLNGKTTPSGAKSDAISFTFTNSRFPGQSFKAEGYRYTGWSGD
ncbi:hypothetical protein M2459_001211 [Parabacteroides sp. PF5-5]|uniref:lipid-binding protein n=1 Tax=unclassified Parabacteroides TaxID=2649774 RepID=UPI0024753EF6|nr:MULTISPECIES: lipid-binding protein [unclassified Parabacteroides]MDH6304478.1 hypothetical protein [Parabacteroides sp. PH5-39]MDH6315369.1 hypothetical protein [Parabacteroides sp. PF5-13]MDH6319137.1 hypothetical protein [Parabacteroides sp. PH5-13]MDH6322867.1 hypothetical protein [Parabacteroides sp. PH5-8]MDH6326561.1 hypothetical protein [Parabacteroides sp. PH5-41]